MKRVIALISIMAFTFTSFLGAEEIPTFDKAAFLASASVRKVLEIGMVDCIGMAFNNNSEILVKKIVPLIEDQNVRIQKSRFEPALTFDFLMEDNTELSTSTISGTNPNKTRTGVFNFGYEQLFTTGTKLDLNFYNTRTASNSVIQSMNPAYDSNAAITITQPLMKGFGIMVNKADYLIAKNNKLKSNEQFVQEVIKVLTDVKKNYYEFQYSQEQYRVAETSVMRVKNLHEINKEKYIKGLASNVDLLQSESEVARMEQALYASEGEMKTAEDNLKYITNMIDDVDYWNADIVLLDELSYEKEEPKLTEAIIKAFDYRPDYKAAQLDLKNRDISVIYTRNGVLPTVDLIGTYSLNGLGKNYEKDLGHIGGGKYDDWYVGVSVNYPILNDEGRGKYEKSKYEKNQALIAFKRLEEDIVLQVRKAHRDVDIAYRMLEASKISKEAETKNYEAQEQRFRAGLVSTLDMVIFQERLARAEVSYVRSIIDYNIALIELAKVEGTTLVENNIKIE
ncbi:MAG: TolC family protein [Candidatus Omnitrophica bacterium]|nr:TolC family protein [Candidatus Omnitrophota bacterium]